MIEKRNRLRIDDTPYETEIPEGFDEKRSRRAMGPHEVRAIIPGRIIEVRVKKGQHITSGQVLMVLEAMKMLNDVEAESDGKIAEILVVDGERVEKNQLMIKME